MFNQYSVAAEHAENGSATYKFTSRDEGEKWFEALVASRMWVRVVMQDWYGVPIYLWRSKADCMDNHKRSAAYKELRESLSELVED